jgi:hypothetical protein
VFLLEPVQLLAALVVLWRVGEKREKRAMDFGESRRAEETAAPAALSFF